MKKILIFCEGIADQRFIADCLWMFYSISFKPESGKGREPDLICTGEDFHFEIISTGGYTNLEQELYLNKIRKNKDGISVVVFDADEIDQEGRRHGSGSFLNTKNRLLALQKRKSVDFDFYLWPNNNSDGSVEDLILQLIQEDRKAIMECLENHQKCLKNSGVAEVRHANKKDLIRFYLYTSKVEKTEPRHVDYKNETHWNLNATDTQDLNKLKLFLDGYFKE